MEGFLHVQVKPWLRRLIYRLLVMIPAVLAVAFNVDPLKILVLSQASLSFQLPFATIPLLLFTADRRLMGDFVNSRSTTALAMIVIWQVRAHPYVDVPDYQRHRSGDDEQPAEDDEEGVRCEDPRRRNQPGPDVADDPERDANDIAQHGDDNQTAGLAKAPGIGRRERACAGEDKAEQQ